MIAPERLKPFLLHEDHYLREAVAEYFGDCWSQDEDLIRLVVEACRRYGDVANLAALSRASRFRLTEAGAALILDYLPRTADASAISFLNEALARAPVDLPADAEAALRATANVSPDTVARWQRRREISRRPDLRRELLAFAEQSPGKPNVGEVDLDYADDLIEALAGRNWPDNTALVQMIRDTKDDEGWLPSLVVDLAGSRRLADAIPALVDILTIDTDYYRERAVEALAKINDPEAVRLTRQRYPKWPWHARLYASELLSYVKHPETEEAILALLEGEKKRDLQTWLCTALCGQFSERGIEVVRRKIESGYDRDLTTLEEDLLPVLDILGVTLPEADAWRKRREEREGDFRERVARWKDEMDGPAVAEDEGAGGPPADSSWDGPQAPFVHTEERVGRNDLCPCGSGKKFKKCCGRR